MQPRSKRPGAPAPDSPWSEIVPEGDKGGKLKWPWSKPEAKPDTTPRGKPDDADE